MTIFPACSGVGGFGCGVGYLGFRATSAGLLEIHSQRTAAANAPRMMKCNLEIVALDSGRHLWGLH
ncbi:MAG TPA: hypothetical protein VG674_01360 [Amycolatopsis sp.]|nr:hypothetical protein [Amycolatopsis sp.]